MTVTTAGRSDPGRKGVLTFATRAPSLWTGAGRPQVVQRILGHASAAMTMDHYGHLIDHNLWAAAKLVGGILGHLSRTRSRGRRTAGAVRGSDLR